MRIKNLVIVTLLAILGFSMPVATVHAASAPQTGTSDMPSPEMMAQMMVSMFNSDDMKKEMLADSDGMFDSFFATSEGRQITMNYTFSEDMNLDLISESEKAELLNSFTEEFSSDDDFLKEIKDAGLQFRVVFTDQYGNKIEKKIK